jgi:hypothetical protein
MRDSENGQDELVDLWLMMSPSTRPHAADGRLSHVAVDEYARLNLT